MKTYGSWPDEPSRKRSLNRARATVATGLTITVVGLWMSEVWPWVVILLAAVVALYWWGIADAVRHPDSDDPD